jgi:hypothetical protein
VCPCPSELDTVSDERARTSDRKRARAMRESNSRPQTCESWVLSLTWGYQRTPRSETNDLSAGHERTSGTLGTSSRATKYAVGMDGIQRYLVSASGQMSVPAAVRHRWHLDQGGPVDVIDLGFGLLTVPAGEAKRLLGDLLSREDHAKYVESLANDPDLATT